MKQYVRDERRMPFITVLKSDLAILDAACSRYDTGLGAAQVRSVYFALLQIADDRGPIPVVLTRKQVASVAGVSGSSVARAIPPLESAGLLEVTEQPGVGSVWTLLSSIPQTDDPAHTERGSSPVSPGSKREGAESPESPDSDPSLACAAASATDLHEENTKLRSEDVVADTQLRIDKSQSQQLRETTSGSLFGLSSDETSNDVIVDALLPSPPKPKSDIQRVFEHWADVMNHPRAVLDGPRRHVLGKALEKRSVEDCCLAIDGCASSDFHMKRGDYRYRDGSVADGLDLIFRNADKIEGFMERASSSSPKPKHRPGFYEGIGKDKEDVRRAWAVPDDERLTTAGDAASERLIANGFEIIRSASLPPTIEYKEIT